MKCFASSRIAGFLGLLVAVLPAFSDVTAETNGTPELPIADSNVALRSYLQLQEQIRATQKALDNNRLELELLAIKTESIAATNARQMDERLAAIERSLADQRQRAETVRLAEREDLQKATWLVLIVAGVLCVLGLATMLTSAYLQQRASSRLSEVANMFPSLRALPPADSQVVTTGAATQANARLFGALDQLEKRIFELEGAMRAPLPAGSNGIVQPNGSHDEVMGEEADKVSVLLAKGESLLRMDKAKEALACYDEILSFEPRHAEAMVKKGTALEQLSRVEEALNCYDRAIELDGALTMAYLQKGGLFNRLERYEEALKCYEQALRSQEKGESV